MLDWIFDISFGKDKRTKNLEILQKINEKLPGPADYDLNTSQNLAQTPIIRSRLPDLIQDSKKKVPGVGEYDVHEMVKQLPIQFPREARSSSPKNKNDQIPGPGSYFPLLLQHKPDSPLFRLDRNLYYLLI